MQTLNGNVYNWNMTENHWWENGNTFILVDASLSIGWQFPFCIGFHRVFVHFMSVSLSWVITFYIPLYFTFLISEFKLCLGFFVCFLLCPSISSTMKNNKYFEWIYSSSSQDYQTTWISLTNNNSIKDYVITISN